MLDRTHQRLGNYRIIKLLGKGGFADVYLAEHIYLQTQTAIKVLHTLLTEQETENFVAEARIIASLRHPHIIQVLEFGIDEHIPFLVMAFAPNGTMRTRHPRGTRVPLPDIVAYVNQIASALQYVHDQKLIYRDLKPENMLLGHAGEILLSDFGIAMIAQTSYNNRTLVTAGTIAYMPPEQLVGKPRFASDQYALGISVYEWLCGERPFSGTYVEMASQHMFTSPSSLQEKLPFLPSDVEQVVRTALAKDPSQRFASVQAFAKAFEQAAGLAKSDPPLIENNSNKPTLASFPLTTPRFPLILQETNVPTETNPPFSSEQHTPPIDLGNDHPMSSTIRTDQKISRRRILAGIAGGLIAVGGASSLIVWFTRQHTGTPSSPHQPAPGIGHLYLTYKQHRLSVYDAKWSPDGTLIASASNDATARIWNASSGETRVLYRGHAASVNTIDWSHDGKTVASGGSDLKIQVWEASSGNLLSTYSAHTQNIRTLAWSPDGQLIASAGDDGKVHIWEALSTKRKFIYTGHKGRIWTVAWSPFIYTGHKGRIWTVAWSPDGQLIASGGDDKIIRVWNPSSGKLLRSYKGHKDQVKSLAWSPDGHSIVSGSNDRTVHVWNVSTGQVMFVYSKHVDVLNSVAWSPDGQRVASGSGDYTTHLWDAFTGKNSYTYSGHLLAVHAVTWSPNGTRIATASDDHTVQVWKSV